MKSYQVHLATPHKIQKVQTWSTYRPFVKDGERKCGNVLVQPYHFKCVVASQTLLTNSVQNLKPIAVWSVPALWPHYARALVSQSCDLRSGIKDICDLTRGISKAPCTVKHYMIYSDTDSVCNIRPMSDVFYLDSVQSVEILPVFRKKLPGGIR